MLDRSSSTLGGKSFVCISVIVVSTSKIVHCRVHLELILTGSCTSTTCPSRTTVNRALNLPVEREAEGVLTRTQVTNNIRVVCLSGVHRTDAERDSHLLACTGELCYKTGGRAIPRAILVPSIV